MFNLIFSGIAALVFISFSVFFLTKKEYNVLIAFLFGGCILAFLFCVNFYDFTRGTLARPTDLNKKIIYQVVGRMQVEGKTKEVFALADGKGKIRYVESDPLPDSTRFVRITKTEKGLNKLEPADTTTNNDRKPVSKETGFILFLKEYLYKHLLEIALH